MKWFRHDAAANQDAKLKRVRMKYGMEGYGLYWYCIELVASNVEQNKITFELEHDAEIISFDTGIHYERVNEMMAYMVDLGLFEDSSGTITCMKLAKRADEYTAKYLKTKLEVINSRHTPDTIRTISSPKEMKGDEKKLNKTTVFKKPTYDEVFSYMTERQWTSPETRANDWLDYYMSNGFKIGKAKTPMKDWKAAVRTWEKDGKHRKADYSGIPIDQIASEYQRLLYIHTGYNPGLLSDIVKSNIAKIWNGDVNSQNLEWWTGFFTAIKKKAESIDPQYMPSRYKFDKLVGIEFENVINEL